MKRVLTARVPTPRFDAVSQMALTLRGVTLETKYDSAPVLKLGGAFLAGLASHVSAEPDTLVVRMELEERELLLEEAPDVYYITDYYERYPVVLVRLLRVSEDALRDLLAVSWRLTLPKGRLGRKPVSRTGHETTKARNNLGGSPSHKRATKPRST